MVSLYILSVVRIAESFSVSSLLFYANFFLESCKIFFPSKQMFISAIFSFDVESLLSGIAPNSAIFITGRAVIGIGFAGIVSGSLK